MNNLKLRTRLILILSIVLVLAFVFNSLISYMVSKDLFRNSSLVETLPLISNNILTDIQNDLMMPIHVSSLMANDTLLKDWALGGEKDMVQVTRYLKEIKEKYDFFSSFFVSGTTGRYYYYKGVLKIMSPTDPHDDWYYSFKKDNKSFRLDVDTDEATNGTLTVFINHRIEGYNHEFLGVTGVGLNMKQFGRILEDYKSRYGREVYLVNKDGLIEVHPNKALIEKVSISDMEGIKDLAPEILSIKDGSRAFEFDRAGAHVLLAVRYFPKFNWYIIVEQEENVTIGGIRTVMYTNLAVGLAVTLLVLVMVALVVNHFQGRLETMAALDELTGLANRRSFLELLNTEAARAVRYNRDMSLLMVDADGFKSINDKFGHHSGDLVLIALAQTISRVLRDSDSPGRLGGEEFAVILPETGLQEAVRSAERIRAAVEEMEVAAETGPIRITISVGVAELTMGAKAVPKILREADQAMYLAKQRGRNQVAVLPGETVESQ